MTINQVIRNNSLSHHKHLKGIEDSCNQQLNNGVKLHFWVTIPTRKGHEVTNTEDIYVYSEVNKK
jgi:hypothetical protein